jgi:hypothetical protein
MKKIALLSVVIIGVLLLSCATQAQDANKKPEAGPQIAELKLGTGVQDKQIVGEDSTFALNGKVYVWMKVTGASGDSLNVTWKQGDHSYNGTIFVGGNSWRTWAYKTVSATGDWTVTVSTQAGDVLKEATFSVK